MSCKYGTLKFSASIKALSFLKYLLTLNFHDTESYKYFFFSLVQGGFFVVVVIILLGFQNERLYLAPFYIIEKVYPVMLICFTYYFNFFEDPYFQM